MTYLTHKLALASALSTLALASAPLASAHGDEAKVGMNVGLGIHQGIFMHLDGDKDGDKHDGNKDDNDAKKDAKAVAGSVTAISGTTLTLAGNDSTTYTVYASGGVKGGSVTDVKVGDSVIASGTVSGSTVTSASIVCMTFHRAEVAKKRSYVTAGIVTAVNGSTFTIESLGAHPKTIVTTDASTVIKARGGATTTSAIAVGSQVFVLGTTTATSTTGDSFSASLVRVLGKGFGHLRFWLWF